ncbi:glucosaminidase domain-containing protein [Pedobacter sp.]|uniref:glucosaminidase domain-containing protein n=1 Tax=Pedobacter sp. TaxID=1411316 RepID=UPI003D7F3AE8
MKYKLLFSLLIIILGSCTSRKYSKNNRQIEKQATKSNPDYTAYSTLSYIDAFKTVAIEEMNLYGIPASIILAQGILESGSGNSSLAKYANNHFGVKCTSDWKGKGYYKDDDQQNDCFRVYKDARESYKDHSEFLKRKRYSFLFELDKNDYVNWAHGLKQAGYATNPQYPNLLINLINKYKLHQYDSPETEREKILREDRVFTEINENIPLEKQKFKPVDVPEAKKIIAGAETSKNNSTGSVTGKKFHTVQSGDTLFNISKRYNLTVDELKALNNLFDVGIKIGQQLQVVK